MKRVAIHPAPAPAHAYDVIIEPGVLNDIASLLRDHAPAARYAMITDDTVRELHAERVYAQLCDAGLDVKLYSFPAGEPYKTRATWTSLSDGLSADGFGRDACVLAMGGGVVGDLGGFVAATYLRGVPCVQIPTTLLSMLDASVGGKTGVDTEHGKNLIGSFHQPLLVVIDPTVVWTQEPADMIAGAAEAVKHGAIIDAEYLMWIEAHADALKACDGDALTHLITRSVEIKASIVARDPFEQGERAILNFGHTVGHAVERATHYAMSHGHAVACGMVAEARLGERAHITGSGTADTIARVLSALGLPTAIPSDVDRGEIEAYSASDKKNRGGRVRYVALEEIGRVARSADGGFTLELSVVIDGGGPGLT